MYPEYIMRLYYDREKAMEDPEKFETLCDMFCYESNFDLCDVNSLGDSLKFTVLSFLKFRRDFLTYRYDVPIDPKVLIVFFSISLTLLLKIRSSVLTEFVHLYKKLKIKIIARLLHCTETQPAYSTEC